MLRDHEFAVDVNTRRRLPKGFVFNLADDTAKEIVKSGVGVAVDMPAGDGEEVDLSKLKKDDLEALAAERGVDISEAKTKAEIVALLEAAEAD
ncbi:MAG TPA: hypothetical protein VNQ99_17645 [Xanthobacteraceae bacterium]|nr:hypothetical protein [Xanthobacteraceae bacterium]